MAAPLYFLPESHNQVETEKSPYQADASLLNYRSRTMRCLFDIAQGRQVSCDWCGNMVPSDELYEKSIYEGTDLTPSRADIAKIKVCGECYKKI